MITKKGFGCLLSSMSCQAAVPLYTLPSPSGVDSPGMRPGAAPFVTCLKGAPSGTRPRSSLAVAKGLSTKPSPSTTTVEEGGMGAPTKIRRSPVGSRLGGGDDVVITGGSTVTR